MEAQICNKCKETKAVGKCPVCNDYVCRYCSYYIKPSYFDGKFSFKFQNPIPREVVYGKKGIPAFICKTCGNKIRVISRKIKSKKDIFDILSKEFLESLIKSVTIEKIK